MVGPHGGDQSVLTQRSHRSYPADSFLTQLTNQPIILFFVLFVSSSFSGPESFCFLSYDKTSPSFQLTVRAHKCQLSPLSALHHLCHLNPLLYTKLFHFGICGFYTGTFWALIIFGPFLEKEKLKYFSQALGSDIVQYCFILNICWDCILVLQSFQRYNFGYFRRYIIRLLSTNLFKALCHRCHPT